MSYSYPAPTHLADFLVEGNEEMRKQVNRKYGENTTVFRLNNNINKVQVSWDDKYKCSTGLAIAIDESGKQLLLFDQSIHGYDARMGLTEKDEATTFKTYEIPAGASIILAFQYNGDESDYAEEGSSRHKQDYFGWIIIAQWNNGKLEMIMDHECA